MKNSCIGVGRGGGKGGDSPPKFQVGGGANFGTLTDNETYARKPVFII